MARILVVDDSKVMRVALSKALARIGHEVAGEAKEGQEAIEKYAELSPDAVLLDVNMPGIDGIETARQLCQKDPKAQIIMVSARGEYDLITEALIAGAQAYIAKPALDEVLKNTLEGVLAPENPESRVLAADSMVVFRKMALKALSPLNLGPGIEAKDGIETVLAVCKNPELDLLVLSEELVGLPAKNVLTILQARGQLSGKRVVLFRESTSGVLPSLAGVTLLGTPAKTQEMSELTALFTALLNPETSAHPQFEMALTLAGAYLENALGAPASQARLIRTGNAYFEGNQWLENDELLLTLEHWLLEYLHEGGENHAVWRLKLLRLIKNATGSAEYLPALPGESAVKSESLERTFAPLFDFAERAAPLVSYTPGPVRLGNYAVLTALITKNQRLIPHRHLLPLRDGAYRLLHAISPEIDQPALFECEEAILTLQKIQKRVQEFFELDHKTLFERFEGEELETFSAMLQVHAKGLRQLVSALLDFYTHRFFQALLELGRRNSKIAARFLGGRANPDLQLYDLLEALLGKSTDDNALALLEKARQASLRHWVLASNHPEITEQFKNVIAKTNPEWKFNRVSDGKTLLRWLEANQPSHLLLDSSLMVGTNQPTHAALLKSLPYLKSAVRVTLITPAGESLSDAHRELFGRDIQLPIENAALARRLLLA